MYIHAFLRANNSMRANIPLPKITFYDPAPW